ncbi:MAG TPA: DUF72 domain-containing protein [Pedobacter sp.]|uniref:DUF72 domain-containing protein n=1 Tax=Pedobacter sp. TaxID=1411316 RepID=UPI002C21A611|nr:DUF72 domain-containing protein [Pedobacter sp.]HMI00917.1 DUF72 domain-containing protein [Pedobacter sp.]
MTDWRIGCSGFYYKEWKDIFYPPGLPQKQWFKYYCQHFNTIEINSSFYRQPSPKSFQTWYNDSPDDFLFSIKAPRTITHYKRFIDVKDELNSFYEVINEGLKEKLGCVLFQVPPGFLYTEERMELVLNSMKKGFNNVFEGRQMSWWNTAVLQEFKKHHIIFSGISYPSALPDDVIQDIDPVYYRFHGKPELYKSEYSKARLKDFAEDIKDSHKQVYVYFNNTWGGSALKNSRQLIEITANK